MGERREELRRRPYSTTATRTATSPPVLHRRRPYSDAAARTATSPPPVLRCRRPYSDGVAARTPPPTLRLLVHRVEKDECRFDLRVRTLPNLQAGVVLPPYFFLFQGVEKGVLHYIYSPPMPPPPPPQLPFSFPRSSLGSPLGSSLGSHLRIERDGGLRWILAGVITGDARPAAQRDAGGALLPWRSSPPAAFPAAPKVVNRASCP